MIKIAFGCVAVATTVACTLVQQPLHLAPGTDAPAFAGVGTDGKDYSLKGLTEAGPAFVVFWKNRCPHNPKASSLINSLAKAYGEKVKLVGFVNSPPEGAKKWVEQFSLPYPLLSDPDKETIKAYGLRFSICTFQIGKDGKIEKVFPGYGKESLEGLRDAMASVAGTKAEVDLSSAPSSLTWG